MQVLDITIQAETPEAAAQIALSKLTGPGENIRVTPIGEGIFIASVIDSDASIQFDISEDRMRCEVVSVQEGRGSGVPFNSALFERTLAEQGIVFGVESGVFRQILDKIEAGESASGILVAKGLEPRNGTSGKVVLNIRKNVAAGTTGAHGQVDYHERNFIETVAKDQLLATVARATEGTPGKDVTGKVIPAKTGTPAIFKAAENTYFSPDKTEVRAAMDGMVSYVHNVLSVTDVMTYTGDIDYETGNIHMTKGSVLVRGSVRPGFAVEASGNVVVSQSVSEATLRAGSDVEVREGVIECQVHAEGSITVKYAQNCKLEAGGDVVISNSAHNCEIICGGKLVMTDGKGIIRGGFCRSNRGISVKQCGNRGGIRTELCLGPRNDSEIELTKQRAEINDTLFHIAQFIGDPDHRLGSEHLSEEEQNDMKKVLKKRNELKAARMRINSILHAIKEEHSCAQCATIEVLEMAYPGTEVQIRDARLSVSHPLAKARFSYDVDAEKVAITPII